MTVKPELTGLRKETRAVSCGPLVPSLVLGGASCTQVSSRDRTETVGAACPPEQPAGSEPGAHESAPLHSLLAACCSARGSRAFMVTGVFACKEHS